jgi:hypothetical protein
VNHKAEHIAFGPITKTLPTADSTAGKEKGGPKPAFWSCLL